MKINACITTSWDDGHPLDFRVAELLAANGLRGTFYIPRSARTPTMSPAQVRELSESFEIGGHTLDHVALTRLDAPGARGQVAACKAWVEDVTGVPCPMFCPPLGKFDASHLRMVRDAGFVGMRTVEMMSLDFPRPRGGVMVMPTTLQVFPHGRRGYLKNLARRAAFGNLWRYILHGRSREGLVLADALVELVLRQGGVFHLWGHSWELEEAGQWGRLESVLSALGQVAARADVLTNGQLCREACAPATSPWDAALAASAATDRSD